MEDKLPTIIISVGSIIVLLALFIIIVPSLVVTHFYMIDRWDERRPSVEDSYRNTLMKILGGGAVIVSFFYGYMKDLDLRHSDQMKTASVSLAAARTQLSSSSEMERASGAYSLGTLASIIGDERYVIRQQLAAFIKNHRKIFTSPVCSDKYSGPEMAPIDLQAAIDTLDRRKPEFIIQNRMLNLNKAILIRPNFHGTEGFSDSLFEETIIVGLDARYANFRNSSFAGSALSDWESYNRCFDSGDAWKKDTAYEQRWVDSRRYSFIANFEGAHLEHASFKGASLGGANFQNAHLKGVNWKDADVSRADFSGSDLQPTELEVACQGDDPPTMNGELLGKVPKCK